MEAVHAIPQIKIVGGIVLAAGSNLQPVAGGGVALQPRHVAGGITGGQSGVLAGGLLAPAPPWVPENIHIWAPVRQSSYPSIVHCSCFI